ncbi:hypothetical protein [Sphingomonas sp.]|uniref:hypothetical protein n=1 Tax=Sphingomonas sp. TaxID=28214 RepID=UPI0031D2BE5A
MIVTLFAMTLAFQQTPQEQPRLSDRDGRPAPSNDQLRDMDARMMPARSTPEALRTIQRFGACIANASTAKATATLAGDFRTPTYRRAIDQLVDANRLCPESRGWYRMRASRLLLAGAIAERLVERDGRPVNVELAKAAAKPAASTYSPTDSAAMCVVRSVPDDVAKLFASEVASDGEKAAADAVQPVMARCLNNPQVQISIDGLRAMLATAAFRSIHATAAVASRN